MSQQGVVTPEAVVLQYRPANVGSRIAAVSLDLAIWVPIYTIAVLCGVLFYSSSDALPVWIGVTALTLLTFGLLFFYPILFETFWNGRTPGKAALGLRVVTVEGAPVRFRHAAIRSFVGFFETFSTAGFVSSFAVFLGPGGRRVGDHAAGTIVLRERSAQNLPSALQFHAPEGAGEFAQSMDVSMLTSNEYVTIRTFLVRSSSLERNARIALATELGRRFVKRTGSQPPSWLTAEGYLLCLATAYQRRFQVAS